MSLREIMRAGLVRRWHSNPDMCHVIDPIDAHSGRVARLVAFLWPQCSGYLLRAALRHDDGEVATGDVSALVKDRFPEIAEACAIIEAEHRQALWGADPELTHHERDRLHFADRLDAYLMAQHHAPHILTGDGWPKQEAWLRGKAHALGVAHVVEPLL